MYKEGASDVELLMERGGGIEQPGVFPVAGLGVVVEDLGSECSFLPEVGHRRCKGTRVLQISRVLPGAGLGCRVQDSGFGSRV